MAASIRALEPKAIWNYFADISAIPRASKREEQIIAHMRRFGESLGLETTVDGTGNVIIKKPATSGMENRQTVILQSHLDMVHQKNSDTVFDFDTEGIRTFIDGDWVRAEGTTLGADNGIGVTAIMALLASDRIPHPQLEALFTIDEETGMTGAKELRGDQLSGTILLNLDSEIDDELTIGCAGGLDTTAFLEYEEQEIPKGYAGFRIGISGLKGGHSGMDIHLGRGNANKMLIRLLYALQKKAHIKLAHLDGGGLRNAIPREAYADLAVPALAIDDLQACLKSQQKQIHTEYKQIAPALAIEIEKIDIPKKVLPDAIQRRIIAGLYTIHNGVFRMSPDIPELVETSSNLARIVIGNGKFSCQTMQRSSTESGIEDIANAICAAFELMGAKVEQSGDYPGWAPKTDSVILRIVADTYQDLFGDQPKILACHAGIECGIIAKQYPKLDMISFGPNIRGAHSPDERAQISSVQKFWKLLQAVLANMPE